MGLYQGVEQVQRVLGPGPWAGVQGSAYAWGTEREVTVWQSGSAAQSVRGQVCQQRHLQGQSNRRWGCATTPRLDNGTDRSNSKAVETVAHVAKPWLSPVHGGCPA